LCVIKILHPDWRAAGDGSWVLVCKRKG